MSVGSELWLELGAALFFGDCDEGIVVVVVNSGGGHLVRRELDIALGMVFGAEDAHKLGFTVGRGEEVELGGSVGIVAEAACSKGSDFGSTAGSKSSISGTANASKGSKTPKMSAGRIESASRADVDLRSSFILIGNSAIALVHVRANTQGGGVTRKAVSSRTLPIFMLRQNRSMR